MMRHVISGVCALSLLAIAIGCQQLGGGVGAGKVFEVTEDFRHKAALTGADDEKQHFDIIIPKGTLLRATKKAESHQAFFNAEIIAVGELKDPEAIEAKLVPATVRSLENYQGYYLVIPVDMIGKRLKPAG